MLYLTAADVSEVVSMSDAVEAIEQACKEQANGDTLTGERQNLRFTGGWIRLMPAVMSASGVFGYKEFHLVTIDDTSPSEAHVRYTTNLFDLGTGEALCAVDANDLTALRTGAAAGVATERLAPRDPLQVAIIGSGAEARTQIEAVSVVRRISEARVFGRDPQRRERFAEEMSKRLGFPIKACRSPQEAIAGAGAVVVATLTDGEAALLGKWLEPGQHVNSIGSTMPTQREIDPEVWRRSAHTVLDSRAVLSESGDALAAAEVGALDDRSIVELMDLVTGRAPGRLSSDEITLYKSVGTGMQDLAVAYLAFRRAAERGIGREVPDHRSVKTVRPN